MKYSGQQDVYTQQTLSSLTEAVGERHKEEERFEIHCQESQTDIANTIEITLYDDQYITVLFKYNNVAKSLQYFS